MKRMRRLLCVLAAALLLGHMAAPTRAQGSYTYTIRIFSGQQGTYDGKTVVEYRDCEYNKAIEFNLNKVKLKDDSKYYVRGIRESGRDNDTAVEKSKPSFRVTEDRDYVVVYGILSDKTSYTIEYVDEAGRELAPRENYYGNVGDKPVIAYLYIEGYHPQAYNLTRTLSEDAGKNVFRFVYTPGEDTGRGSRTTERTTVIDGGVREVGGEGASGEDAGEAQAGEPRDQENETEEIPDETTPMADEVLDLDDERTPLGPLFDLSSDAKLLGVPVPLVVASAGILTGCGVWLFLLMKRRKRERAS